jgi:hypothetical protein
VSRRPRLWSSSRRIFLERPVPYHHVKVEVRVEVHPAPSERTAHHESDRPDVVPEPREDALQQHAVLREPVEARQTSSVDHESGPTEIVYRRTCLATGPFRLALIEDSFVLGSDRTSENTPSKHFGEYGRGAYRQASGRWASTSASSDGYTSSFKTTSSSTSASASALVFSSTARNRSGSRSGPR